MYRCIGNFSKKLLTSGMHSAIIHINLQIKLVSKERSFHRNEKPFSWTSEKQLSMWTNAALPALNLAGRYGVSLAHSVVIWYDHYMANISLPGSDCSPGFFVSKINDKRKRYLPCAFNAWVGFSACASSNSIFSEFDGSFMNPIFFLRHGIAFNSK